MISEKAKNPIHYQALLDENTALKEEIQSLRMQLEEAEELRRAISEGDLDALVIPGQEGDLIFTLESADRAYRTLVETMNEGTATLAYDGTVLYCNRSFADILKISPQVLMGRSINEFIAPESENILKALLNQSIKAGELNLRTKTGSSVPVYLSVTALQEEEAESGWCLVATDLTEQKKREEIVASERLARSIIEQAAEIIIVCDEAGRIIRFSNAAPRLCECNLEFKKFEDIIDLRFSDGEEAGKKILPISAALKGANIFSLEAVINPKSLQPNYFLLNSGSLTNEAGEIIGCVVTLTDITERKKVEESEERLKVLMNYNPSLVFMKDECGRYVYLNSSYEKEFVHSKDWYGKTDFDFWQKESAELFRENDSNVLKSGQMQQFIEDSTDLNGTRHCWLNYKFPFVDSKNERYIGGIGIDITDRLRAEEALKESEQRFRLALRNSPVSVSVQDLDLRFIWAYNQRTARPEEVIGKFDADIFLPEEAARLTAIKQHVLEKNAEVREQMWLCRPGGRMFLDVCFEPIHDKAGRVTGVGTATIDLTQMKTTEEALKASEEKYRLLFETMTEGFAVHEIILDEHDKPCDYRFLDVNPVFEKLTGVKRADLIGKRVLEVFPDTEQYWIDGYGKVSLTGEPIHKENYFSELDRWYEVIAYRTEPKRFAVVFTDITERKRIEKELQEAQELAKHRLLEIEDLYHHAPIGLCMLDSELRYVRINERLAEINGVPAEAHIGKTVRDVLPELADIVEPQMLHILKTGEPRLNIEIKGETPAQPGVTRCWMEQWLPITDDKGSVLGLSIVVEEITERKKAQEALRLSKERFEILSNVNRRLLASDRPQDIIEVLGLDVMKFLDCEAFFNYLMDENEGCLHLNAWAGISDETAKKIERLELEEAVCGCVANLGERIIVENILEIPDPRTKLLTPLGITAYACHPLMDNTEILGTLSFGTCSRMRFSDEDISMMKAVADAVSVAITRFKTEEALAREKSLLNSVMQATDFMLVFLDPEFNLVWVNPAYAETCKMKPEEMVGKNHFALYHDLENEAIFRQVRDTGESVFYKDKPFIYQDQPERGITYWDWDLAPVKRPDGEVTGLVLSMRETTKFKKAEEARLESEAKYRQIIETAQEGIWLIDSEDRTIFVNQRLPEMLGYSVEEILGQSPKTFMAPEFRIRADNRLNEHIQGTSHKIDYRLVRKDGSDLWCILSSTPMFDDKGEYSGSLAMLTDITERKSSEQRILRYNRVLNGINRIFESVVKAETGEELGKICLSVALEVAGGEIGFIGEVGSDGLLHDLAISDMGWSQCSTYDKTGHHRPPGNFAIHGLYGNVIESGKAFFTNDPEAHPYSTGLPSGHPALKAFLGVPLISDGKVTGMIAVANHEVGYNPEKQEDLEALAPAVLQALQRNKEEQERKKAQKALLCSEEKLRVVVQNVRSGVALVDETGKFALVNPSFLQMFSLDSELDILNVNSQDWSRWEVYGEDGNLLHVDEHPVRKAVITGKPVKNQLVAVQNPGQDELTWMLISAELVMNEATHTYRVICTYHDITERKKIEKELFDTTQRLSILMNSLPVGVSFSEDASCQKITGNPEFLAQFEIGPEDNISASAPNGNAPGRKVRYFKHGKQMRDIELPLQRAVAENKEISDTFEIELPSGRRWIVETSASPIHDEFGNVIGGIAATLDITRRKQAEDALLESRNQLATIFDASPVGIFFSRLEDGLLKDVNQTYLDILGYSKEEVLGHTSFELDLWVNPKDREYFIENLIQQGRLDDVAIQYRRKNGDIIDVSVSLLPIEIGGELCLLGTLEDITERKRIETALKESEQHLSDLLSSIQDGFFELDQDWRFTYINKRAAHNVGFEPEELLGKCIWEVFPWTIENGYGTAFKQVMETHISTRFEIESQIENRWYAISVYPAESGISVFWTEITEQKEAERILREAYEKIQIQSEELHMQAEELEETNQALSKSEERLRLLGDNLPESAVYQYIHEPDGRVAFLYFSEGIEKLNAVKAEDVLQDPATIHRQILPEYRKEFFEAEARSARELSDFDIEVPMQLPNGQVSWMQLHSRPRRLPDGTTIWDGVQIDVTRRKKIEEELNESEARKAFLLLLGDRLRELNTPEEMMNSAAEMLGKHLKANRAGYAEIDDSEEFADNYEWTDGTVPSTAGLHTLKDWRTEVVETYLKGGVWKVDDVQTDPRPGVHDFVNLYSSIGTRSTVAYPLLRAGKWMALIFLHSASPRVWKDNEIELIKDVTERTWEAVKRARAEAAFKKSQKKYQTLFDSISEGFAYYQAIYDTDGDLCDLLVLDINPAGAKLSGVEGEVQIGKTWCEIWDGIENYWFDYYRRADKTGKSSQYENFSHIMGRWYSIQIDPIGNSQFAVAFRDITERKQAEEIFKKSHDMLEKKVKDRTAELEEAYNTLLENELRLSEAQRIAHLGNWDWNVVTDELYWSNEMYRIFGLDPVKFGANYDAFLNYVHPEDREDVENAVRNSLTGEPYSIEFRIISEKEEEKIVHAQGEVIFDKDKKPVRMRGTTQDITERRRAEEAMEKIDKMRIKEIHHRIKNNLQVISSLLSLEAEKFSDEKMLEAFKESQDRVVSMALIHEELYKGDKFDTLDFAHYLRKLTEDLFRSYTLEDKTICLNLNLEQIYLGMDTAIPLGIIVNELVSNSLKHAFSVGSNGEIQINLSGTEDAPSNPDSSDPECQEKSFQYVLTVTDDGKGIPEDIDLENPDFLGLQLVNILVEQIDGCMELKNEKGTKFVIYFDSLEE